MSESDTNSTPSADEVSAHLTQVDPALSMPTPQSLTTSDQSPGFADFSVSRLPNYDWAAQILGEPQYTISDMLGPVHASDPLWTNTFIENVFDVNFPSSYDVLGGNMDVLSTLQ